MKHSGLLGLPRLTSAGPLVKRKIELSATIEKDRAKQIVREAAEEQDVPSSDMTEEEFQALVREVASTIYPKNTELLASKNDRFQRCMEGRWVTAWVVGLEEEVDTISFSDELDKVTLMTQGCAGVTEANTADDEIIIPERFKE